MKENIISYIPLKLYRYLRWLNNERKIYQYNKVNFSEEYAKICFSADDAIRKKLSLSDILRANEKKDQYIMDYLMRLIGDVVDNYKKVTSVSTGNGREDSRKIWVFWWTGEDSAPEIVKACIRSIRRNANGHDVVMLDRSNYQNYITLPKVIIDKHDKGIIGHAHFSDIIRLSLLSKYGGMWIDATVFISQPIPEAVFEEQFYTMKTYNPNSEFFSKSRWAGYFLSGDKNFPLFSFAGDCLIEHWKRTDKIIDYLLMDYVFELAYQNIDSVRKAIDRMPDNNFKRGNLMAAINAEYDESLFNELATQETFASKLSWRYGNPHPTTDEGKLTNYGYLIKL
ncbi:MAG: capsular polysaccharide synthesis protein [Eubacterium sp.]